MRKDLSMSTITVPSDVANLLGLGITILLPAVLIGIGVEFGSNGGNAEMKKK